MGNWQEAVEFYTGKDIKTVAQRLGAESMTKSCYTSETHPEWVVLVASDAKKRILEAEVTQLLALKEHLPVVSIGPKDSPVDAMFACTLGAKSAVAFLEAKLDNYVEVKVFKDDGGGWFYDNVVGTLKAQDSKEAWDRVKESITQFESYLTDNAEGIPDMQVAFERTAMRLLLFDPGDPLNSESRRDKDLKAIKRWSLEWERAAARVFRPRKPRVGQYPFAQAVDDSGDSAAKPKLTGFCEHGEPAALCKKC